MNEWEKEREVVLSVRQGKLKLSGMEEVHRQPMRARAYSFWCYLRPLADIFIPPMPLHFLFTFLFYFYFSFLYSHNPSPPPLFPSHFPPHKHPPPRLLIFL